jgi:hypothetical protein
MSQSPRSLLPILALLAFSLSCFGLFSLYASPTPPPKTTHTAPPASRPAAPALADHKPRLGNLMSQLQYFSQKLGYAIQGRHAELANFYIHELEENTEDLIKYFPDHKNMKKQRVLISQHAKTMLLPVIEKLEEAIKKKNWKEAPALYNGMIQQCNACHQITGYGFIVLTPASGRPPYNQRFTP